MKSPKTPEAPVFHPINIESTLQKAIQFDVQGYDESDKYFADNLPGLVAARKQTVTDAYQQLVGPISPDVQRAFTQSGIEKGLSVTGGGNAMAGLPAGSLGQNVAGTSIARDVLQKQDYDRNYLQSLIDQNPQRAFGLSGNDALALMAYNVKGGNVSGQQNYAAQLAGIQAQGQQGVQTGQAIAGVGSTIAGLGSLFNNSQTSDNRLKKNIKLVGLSPRGIPIVEFNYVGGKGLPEGRFRGVIAQDVLKIVPDAVEYHANDYMTVNYSYIDVKHEKIADE